MTEEGHAGCERLGRIALPIFAPLNFVCVDVVESLTKQRLHALVVLRCSADVRFEGVGQPPGDLFHLNSAYFLLIQWPGWPPFFWTCKFQHRHFRHFSRERFQSFRHWVSNVQVDLLASLGRFVPRFRYCDLDRFLPCFLFFRRLAMKKLPENTHGKPPFNRWVPRC